jgi:hypothetical protein
LLKATFGIIGKDRKQPGKSKELLANFPLLAASLRFLSISNTARWEVVDAYR